MSQFEGNVAVILLKSFRAKSRIMLIEKHDKPLRHLRCLLSSRLQLEWCPSSDVGMCVCSLKAAEPQVDLVRMQEYIFSFILLIS